MALIIIVDDPRSVSKDAGHVFVDDSEPSSWVRVGVGAEGLIGDAYDNA